ncbi:MAG: hypothetical protein U1F53_06780 [Burkholderiaceae bacterium]
MSSSEPSELREAVVLAAGIIARQLRSDDSWPSSAGPRLDELCREADQIPDKRRSYVRLIWELVCPTAAIEFATRHPQDRLTASTLAELVDIADSDHPSKEQAQRILCASLLSSLAAEKAVHERFGTWSLPGLRDLKNYVKELRVTRALLANQELTDLEAFKLAGVSASAGKRVKRRLLQ